MAIKKWVQPQIGTDERGLESKTGPVSICENLGLKLV
jgi:hypothetical protein